MFQSQWIGLTVVLVCTILVSLLVAAETALMGFSRGRTEKLIESRARGAGQVRLTVQDLAPSTNAVMFIRMSFGVTAMALVALVVFQSIEDIAPRLAMPVAILLVVFFMPRGVAPRTIGR